jgi:hypothetical protein
MASCIILNISDHTKTNFDLNDTISLNFNFYERKKLSNRSFAFYGILIVPFWILLQCECYYNNRKTLKINKITSNSTQYEFNQRSSLTCRICFSRILTVIFFLWIYSLMYSLKTNQSQTSNFASNFLNLDKHVKNKWKLEWYFPWIFGSYVKL